MIFAGQPASTASQRALLENGLWDGKRKGRRNAVSGPQMAGLQGAMEDVSPPLLHNIWTTICTEIYARQFYLQ